VLQNVFVTYPSIKGGPKALAFQKLDFCSALKIAALPLKLGKPTIGKKLKI
jgi:hypothetical protein